MRAAFRVLPFALLALAPPAAAQERAGEVRLPAGRLDTSVRLLAEQTRASIGLRVDGLAARRTSAVKGRFTPRQALERLLAGTGARARRLAPGSYLIELLPAPVSRNPVARRPAPPPPLLPPPALIPSDVIVTASKRGVPLADYPGGVTVIDGNGLSTATAARGSDAIEMLAASVSSTHLGPGRNKLFIRGIADSSFVGPTQATVGQYWGNSRITYSAPDPSLRLYDVARIEVLEGPQGTLYGAGSLGGVVRVVPNAPDLAQFGGQLWAGAQAVEHGSLGGDGGAVVNVPLVGGTLGLRAVVFGTHEGGYIDDRQRDRDDVNSVGTLGGRLALRFEPGDDWLVDLSAVGQRIRGADSQYADRGDDGLSRASAIAQPYRNDFWLADAVVRKQWGALELTSTLGYAGQRVFETFEGPALDDPTQVDVRPAADAAAAAYSQGNRIAMVTGETRLTRRGRDHGGWVLGLSVLHNVARVRRQFVEAMFEAPLAGVRNQADEVTIYGEGSIALTPKLTLTAGERLTRSVLSGRAEDVADVIALRIDPQAGESRAEFRVLPSAALTWRPAERWTVFARYQEGFRPGGIAVRQDYIQRFVGDRTRTVEAGVRLTGKRLNIAGTLAATDWRDIQADVIDGFGFPATVNIGRGRVLSIGAHATWNPLPRLVFDAALYLNDSRVIESSDVLLSTDVGRVNRNRLPNVADASGRFGLSYSAPIAGGDRIDVNGYLRYVGASTLGIGTVLGRLQGDYVDTGLEVSIGSDRRSLSLTATNLLDLRGNRFALGSPFLIRDQDQITPLQPRSVRLGFSQAF